MLGPLHTMVMALDSCVKWPLVGVLKEDIGPLHTQAKSRDHEIVRAQMKVCKGHPKTPPKSCSMTTDL